MNKIYLRNIKWRDELVLSKVYVDTYNFFRLVKLAPHSEGKVPVRLVVCKFLSRSRRPQYLIILREMFLNFKFVLFKRLSFMVSFKRHHFMMSRYRLQHFLWYFNKIMLNSELKFGRCTQAYLSQKKRVRLNLFSKYCHDL